MFIFISLGFTLLTSIYTTFINKRIYDYALSFIKCDMYYMSMAKIIKRNIPCVK